VRNELAMMNVLCVLDQREPLREVNQVVPENKAVWRRTHEAEGLQRSARRHRGVDRTKTVLEDVEGMAHIVVSCTVEGH